MNTKTKGVLFLVVGAILFSMKAIIIKLTYAAYPIDPLSLLTLRFGFSLPIFLIIAIYKAKKGEYKNVSNRDLLAIVGLSFLGYYLASYFDFLGLKYISAGLERIILFIYPTFVVLLSAIFLKKKIVFKTGIALLLSYLGIIFIGIEPRIFNSENFSLGLFYIGLSSFTYAIYLTFGAEQIKKYGSGNFNSLAMVFSSVLVIIHYLLFSNISLFSFPAEIYFSGLMLAIFSTVIPTFMVMEGIKILGANDGAIISSVGPVSTIFLAYFILGEEVSFQEIIGSILVLVGVYFLSSKK